MKGVCLQLYLNEFDKYKGILVYEWILEFAKKNSIHGGCVFKAIAGYGRHGKLHEEHFFELASNTPVKIEFFLLEEKAKEFIDLLKKESLNIFYSISSSEFSVIEKQ
jgi:uncharacterized protein